MTTFKHYRHMMYQKGVLIVDNDTFTNYNCYTNQAYKNNLKKNINKNKKKKCKSIKTSSKYKKYPSQKYRYKRYKIKSKCKYKKRRYNNCCCTNNSFNNKCNYSEKVCNTNGNYSCKKRRRGCGCFSPLWWLLFFLII